MNVDILEANPPLSWYFIVAVPFMALVIGVWMLCKHLPVCHHPALILVIENTTTINKITGYRVV